MATQTGKVRAKGKQTVDRGTIDDPDAFAVVPDPNAYPSHTMLRGVSCVIFSKGMIPQNGELGYVGLKDGKCMIGRIVIKETGTVVVVTDCGPLEAHVFTSDVVEFLALAIERREKLPRRAERPKPENGIPIHTNQSMSWMLEDDRIMDAISCAVKAPDPLAPKGGGK